jgi:hypothetical protein
MNWLRFAGFVFCLTLVAADAPKASPESEAKLKATVSKFWDGFVAAKFRQSDMQVCESAKDDFFVWPKKQIRGYKIMSIYYSDEKTAKVVANAATDMSMMGVGKMDIDQPIETWWKIDGENWCWFKPANEIRQTPFGPMQSNVGSGQTPLVPNGQIVTPPDQETIYNAVKPDKTEVRFALGKPGEAVIEVRNSLPGTVGISLDVPPGDDLSFELGSRQIQRNGITKLTIRYQPKTQPAAESEVIVKQARLGIPQTGKIYNIRVLIEPAR